MCRCIDEQLLKSWVEASSNRHAIASRKSFPNRKGVEWSDRHRRLWIWNSVDVENCTRAIRQCHNIRYILNYHSKVYEPFNWFISMESLTRAWRPSNRNIPYYRAKSAGSNHHSTRRRCVVCSGQTSFHFGLSRKGPFQSEQPDLVWVSRLFTTNGHHCFRQKKTSAKTCHAKKSDHKELSIHAVFIVIIVVFFLLLALF